jgi:hypothetical protein
MLMDLRERAGLLDPVEEQNRIRRAPVKALASESGRYKFGASAKNLAGCLTLSDGYWAAAAAWSVGVILSTTWGSSWVIIYVRWLGSTPNFAAA